MEEEKKKVQKLTMKVLLVLTAVIAAYIIYALVTKYLNIGIFEVLLALFVVIYLVMSDIIEPWKLGLFREMTIGRRDGFVKMMAMDVIGAGALLYWILGMNSEGGGEVLLPLLVYFLTAQMKRKFRVEFEGGEMEAETEETGEEKPEEKKDEEEK